MNRGGGGLLTHPPRGKLIIIKKKGRGREMSKGIVSSAATHARSGKFQAEEVAFRCSANLPCENVHDQSRGPYLLARTRAAEKSAALKLISEKRFPASGI